MRTTILMVAIALAALAATGILAGGYLGVFMNADDRSYAGLTAKEVFPDPNVRQLAEAAADGEAAKVKRLIAAGVKVDGAGKYGVTPLWWTLNVYYYTRDAQCYKTFVALLKAGANPNIRTGRQYDNVMYSAADVRDPRFLSAAVKAGGNVNLRSARGTPIFAALDGPWHRNIRFLISKGANLNVMDVLHDHGMGETPMMAAADLGDYADVYLLLRHGADPTIKCSSGQTIYWNILSDAGRLTPAAEAWRQRVIKWLAKRGFRPHKYDMKNLPPPVPKK